MEHAQSPPTGLPATADPARILQELQVRQAELEAALHSTRQQLEAATRRGAAQLLESTTQLHALAGALILAEERERTRISRLIHDHLQQMLVAALLNFRMLKAKSGDAGLAADFDSIEGMLKDTIATAQTLTAELSPSVLHQYGLAAALHWLRPWCMEKYGLFVEVDAGDDIDPSPEVSVALFLCVRELLFNVIKHAGVKAAALRMWRDAHDKVLTIEVSDQGAGFDPQAGLNRPGLTGGMGLFNSRERLEMLGGGLQAASAPGQGSRFTLWVPVAATAAQNPKENPNAV